MGIMSQTQDMFCFQCEQTAQGKGCNRLGVCGKDPQVAALQDLLVHQLKALSIVATEGRRRGTHFRDIDRFICEAAFATLTNVNFDPDRIASLVGEAVGHTARLNAVVKANLPRGYDLPTLGRDAKEMAVQGRAYGVDADPDVGSDAHGLRWALVYGIKGISAYADHAAILGKEDEAVYAFVERGLAASADTSLGVDGLLPLLMEAGKANLRAMELLDQANTGAYGNPIPTKVPLGHRKGKAILVSGHDLHDLALLLKQTEGKGITIYTHGEMLPTHGYPELKKYPHFYGHYGTAWQNQTREFPEFPGAILMTTNCIQRPTPSYMNNIFTTGMVGWPRAVHITDKNFTPVIEKALKMPGFAEDMEAGSVTVGFGHEALMGAAPQLIDLIKAKKVRHIFLVGGCDGSKATRSYYTEFVEKVPDDCLVLTLACGKFRFFDRDLGVVEGIPRLIDIGQCNDAYSAVQVALALSKAFSVGVNELPLSLVLSWYEQKALAILLTLLSLGIKNIRLGPTLPAFLTPAVVKVLADNYNIMPITTPDSDLKASLG